ncbi:MAG: hypothetical protein D6707_09300 [Bacteroidetes bacterium]|nr:MAG: hypothetical protein D6707_09300 [Bacteroidota bacterium]
MKKVLLVLGLGMITVLADAQGKFGATPEDSVACVKNLSLYKEFYKQKNYKDALPGWRKAFQICPQSRKSLYIDGVNIYKYFIKNASSKEEKKKYVDTLMMVYDARIQHFGQEGFVLGRKGSDLLKYNPSRLDEAMEMLKKSYEMQGKKTEAGVLIYLYNALYLKYKKTNDNTELLEYYPKLIEVADYQINNAKKEKTVKKYTTAKQNIEKIFAEVASCEDLVKLFEPKFNAAPEDTALLKQITQLFNKRDCTDEELFVKAATNLHKANPSPESAFNIGKVLAKKDRCGEAVKYFLEAAEGSSNNETKTDAYMMAAKCSFNNKQFANVRTYAKKALAINPNLGEAYILIGDAYAVSAKSCGDDPCKSKAAYWAAYDKYMKAKSVDTSVAETASKKAANVKAQFPKKADCFFYGLNEGDSFTVECWINETTQVRVQ